MTEENGNEAVRQNKFKEFFNKTNICVLYSILFAVISAAVFSEFIIKDLSFVNKGDGFNQHVRALLYYGRYLRSVVSDLIRNRSLSAPQWDFHIGYGADILAALHYYAVGDPLNLLSAVLPDKLIGYCYTFISILRVYIAGLSFIFFSSEVLGKRSRTAVLIGTLSFVFGFFAVNASGANVFDVDYIMYFPLLLLGLERIIKGKRCTVLILAVFFAGISNFVLFCAIGILMAMYTVGRLFMEYRKEPKKAVPVLIKTALSVALGMSMAAAVLLPAGYSLFNNPRSGMEYKVLPFLSMNYVLEVPANLFSGRDGSYGFMGFMLPVMVLSFGIKDRIVVILRRITVFLWIMFFIPAFSNIVNFFSGYERRWGFLFSILYSSILVCVWDRYRELSKKQILVSGVILVIDILLCILTGNMDYVVITGIVLTAVFLILSAFTAGREGGQKAVIAAVIVIILASNISMLHYEIEDGRYRKAGSMLSRLYANESMLVLDELKDDKDSFHKYSGNIASNGGTTADLSSTSYYWSNFSPESLDLRNDIENMEFLVVDQKGYDNRSVISEVIGCDYYASDEDPARIPYGYSYVSKTDVNSDLRKYEEDVRSKDKELYRNDNPLPFGYTYDEYLPRSEYEKADVFNREQSMLTNLIIDDEDIPEGFGKGKIKDNVTEIPGEYSVMGDVLVDGNRLLVYESYGRLVIKFDGDKDRETGIHFDNVKFKALRNIDRYFGDKSEYDPENRFHPSELKTKSPGELLKLAYDDIRRLGSYTEAELEFEYGNEKKRFLQKTVYEKQYNHRNSFVLNLGFTGTDTVEMCFSKPGIYEFDKEICSVSFEDYDKDVNKRKEYVLENTEFDTDSVSGTIDIPEKKLLFLCLPYAEGWKAYVDGQETKIMKAHDMYSALALDKGKHEIVLKYHTPMRTAGWVVTLVSFIIFILFLMKDKVIKNS